MPQRNIIRSAIAMLVATLLPLASPAQAKSRTATALDAGAAATSDVYGARAAAEILRAGGNAADAAVAVAFVEAVTYPEAGNIGGGFATLWFDGKPYFLDYCETAPAAASATMFLDAHGEMVPHLSLIGNLAAGVPGTVRGMAALHRRFAKLSWARDLAPAIRLARAGFVVNANMIAQLQSEDVRNFPGRTNFDLYFGRAAAGRILRQSELADTLQRIARNGPDEFYTGRTADLLVAQMARGAVKGMITKADLAGYEPIWRDPLITSWRGFTAITRRPARAASP
jgi:gamma-glutamyltranspeptidase/glutathione hydrolase